jgi:hypothetical protein
MSSANSKLESLVYPEVDTSQKVKESKYLLDKYTDTTLLFPAKKR